MAFITLLKISILLLITVYIRCLNTQSLIKYLTLSTHVNRAYNDTTAYSAVIGGETALPCNVTPPSFDDSVSLVLWYRDDTGNPIYSVDARITHLDRAKHFSASEILGTRGVFNITYPMSYLRIKPVKGNDGGEYRCRVDFRRARTINRILRLNVIVPSTKVIIYDGAGNHINDIAGPYNEDSSVNLTCDSEGGNPPPSVIWRNGSVLIDDNYFAAPNGIIRNVLTLSSLSRDNLMMILTCQASNTNLTVPASKTIAIDLNLKPKEVRIFTPVQNMSAGVRVELVCQSSGSRPPAKILWRKGDYVMENMGESTSDDGSVTTNFLVFVPSVDDNGKYLSCSAVNPQFPEFSLEDGWTLNVLYAPLLSLILGANIPHQEIIEESDVYFECNVMANPNVNEIEWFLNDKPLTKSNEILGIQIRNNSLFIQSVKKMHRGKYQCVAVNSEGRGESEIVNLKVQYSPICKSIQKVHYGVAKHEETKIECEVDADPPDVVFHWGFNNSADVNLDVVSFTGDGRKSIATYTPRIDLDYGMLYCWAHNNVGKQHHPCVFFIIEAGPPEPPDNCSVANITAHSLTVECLPGYSGGLDQYYYMEVFSSNPNSLITNISSNEYPFFIANGLPAGYTFKLSIYSSNSKGRSRSIDMMGNTLLVSQLTGDYFEPIIISPLLSVLIAITGALIILAIIIILVMKFKTQEEMNINEDEKEAPNSTLNHISLNRKCQYTNHKMFHCDGNCPDSTHDDIMMHSIGYGSNCRNATMTNKVSSPISTIIPPPESFHVQCIPNMYNQIQGDVSTSDATTSTENSDPTRIRCSVRHNHIVKDSNDFTYADIVLSHNDNQLSNMIGINDNEYPEINFRQSSYMLNEFPLKISAESKRICQTSGESGIVFDNDNSTIKCNNSHISVNKSDDLNPTWVIIKRNDDSTVPTHV